MIEKSAAFLLWSLGMFLFGFWCSFHVPQTLHELDVFRQFAVRKVTGETQCPKGFRCEPANQTK